MTDASTVSPLEELRAALAPRYDVVREIGRGGMATVYLATDSLSNGREVAIKVLLPELSAAMGAERFRREVAIASSLDHARILNAIDAGPVAGSLFLVMPFVRGETLRDRIGRERQLPVVDAIAIAVEVAEALGYAHARGFVHRDVKPENVLLEDGHAIVADFGIARAVEQGVGYETLTRTGIAVGTPLYMSPEQAAAERTLDARADEYSLGCLLYEMLVGEPPFHGTTAQMLMARHALEPVPSIRVARPAVPDHVADAVYRALAKAPADRFVTMDAFVRALGPSSTWTATGGQRRVSARGKAGWRHQRAVLGAAAGVVAALAAGLYGWRHRAATPPADDGPLVSIAVAPFDVADADLQLWHEGMVDLLGHALDGAGPLRAVATRVVLRGWTGAADHLAAKALAVRTGARYAVFGSLAAEGRDGVRLTARILDARTDSVSASFELAGTDVAVLADSASLFVVNTMARTHVIGASSHPTPLGGLSSAALKPFLAGEQAYRRTAWGAAVAAYTRAILLDTASALAYHRLGQVAVWQRDNADSLAREYMLRAGAMNHGLAPRDSLLVQADSLSFAAAGSTSAVPDWALVRRLFATVNDAAARFPDDPEVWFTVGEARFHHGYGQPAGGVTEGDVLAAFDHAIRLDSGYAPAYIHAVELAFTLRGRDEGRRYAAAYLRVGPTGVHARAIALVSALTDPAPAARAAAARLLDTAATPILADAMFALRRWPDSSATALAIARALAARAGAPGAAPGDAAFARYLAPALAYRGHFREARAAAAGEPTRLLSELALLGALPRDSAAALFARWLAAGAPAAERALPWWAAAGDERSVRELARRAAVLPRDAPPERRRDAAYTAAAAQAYALLMRHTRADSAAAVAALVRLSDTLCLDCYVDRLTLARALAAPAGAPAARAAAAVLSQRLYVMMTPIEMLIAMERGRAALRLDQRAEARRAFAFVADAWADGDPETRPYVDEARGALAALGPSRAGGH